MSAEPIVFEDPDLDPTPRPDELRGGITFAAFYGEAEAVGGRHWENATPAERDWIATSAAITDRRAAAQARQAGYPSVAAFLAATEDPVPLRAIASRRSTGRPETDAEAEARWARANLPAEEVEVYRRHHYGDRYVPKTIGCRTAVDLRCGLVLDQLAGEFLTPEGPCVIYGRGGTGKGMVTCWLVRRLVRAGHVVMIVDFEGHEREWGSRLRGLGLTDDELARVHYRAPFGSDWTMPTGALSVVAELIRTDAERLGVTYLIVDSYSVATSNGDTMGGEAAAREYFSALARIGLPSLTIAHVRGDSGRFPDRPFGSVFVHNLARETWAVERVGDDPEVTDAEPFAPHVVALELRNKKANARPAIPAQFVTFSFYADGTIEATDDRPGGRTVADMAADVLADGPMTLPAIRKAIAEDTGESVSEDALRKALGVRGHGRFVQSTGKRPRTWALR